MPVRRAEQRVIDVAIKKCIFPRRAHSIGTIEHIDNLSPNESKLRIESEDGLKVKIFPPISEMLWPPGLSARELLWARRYVVLAAIGITFAFFIPSIFAPTLNLRSAPSDSLTNARLLVNGRSCQNLQIQQATGATTSLPCGASFRMKAGASVAAQKPLPRSALTTTQGTLTADDRAITPPKSLRSSIWGQRTDRTRKKPALAQSPTKN